jgi:nicotinamide-nucleotide amidase
MIPGEPAWDRLEALARELGSLLAARGLQLATAESCTGGLIATLVTEIPGSSQWLECGVVSYSNRAKQALLGVPAELIAEHGAVSAAVVLAMTEGLMRRAPVDCALAVSGVAGPGGGTPDKPVGTVWIAWAIKGAASSASRLQLPGNRRAVRLQAAEHALDGLVQALRVAP